MSDARAVRRCVIRVLSIRSLSRVFCPSARPGLTIHNRLLNTTWIQIDTIIDNQSKLLSVFFCMALTDKTISTSGGHVEVSSSSSGSQHVAKLPCIHRDVGMSLKTLNQSRDNGGIFI